MKKLVILFFSVFLVSCGASNLVYDYDEKQDFSTYKTYNFFPEMNLGLSDLDQKRLIEVTETIMKNKGFVKAINPDVYINFNAVTTRRASNNNVGVGIGGGSSGIGIGVGGSIPIGGPKIYMKITTDLVDVKRDELVWQVVTEKRFYPHASPQVRIEFFQKIMNKAMMGYPPEEK